MGLQVLFFLPHSLSLKSYENVNIGLGLAQAGHDVVTSAFVHNQLQLGRDRLIINISCNFKLTSPNGLTGQADGILIPRLTPSRGRWLPLPKTLNYGKKKILDCKKLN